MNKKWLVLILLLVTKFGYAVSSSSSVEFKLAETGMASWYGQERAGQFTASGQKFDPNRLTAAHRSLPLLSIVEVTNLMNQRKIKVLINDRGPGISDRILDVSYAVAKQLKFVGVGITPIHIQVIKLGPVDHTYRRLVLWDNEPVLSQVIKLTCQNLPIQTQVEESSHGGSPKGVVHLMNLNMGMVSFDSKSSTLSRTSAHGVH